MAVKKTTRRRRKSTVLASPLLMMDESIQLLRTIPLSFWFVYFIGVVPFFAGLIYFLSSMLYGAYAFDFCAISSMGMAVLFIWMKTWQARFCSHLWSWVGGEDAPAASFKFLLRLAGRQLVHQPLGLFANILGVITIAGFPFVNGFFQVHTVNSGLENGNCGQNYRRSLAQLTYNSGNLWLTYLLMGVICVLTILTVGILAMTVPQALKKIVGIESAFSRGQLHVFASPLSWGIILSLTYMILDPVMKALFTLRCFYVESRSTGADLLADLRGVLRRTGSATLLLIGFLIYGGVSTAHAQESIVQPESLEESIRQTLRDPDYSWRMPRELTPEELEAAGPIERLFRTIERNIEAGWEYLAETVQGLFESMGDLVKRWFSTAPQQKSNFNWPSWLKWLPGLFGPWMITALKVIVILVAIAALVFIAVKLVKWWKGRAPDIRTASGEDVQVDLEDENVTADQLPEDDWMLMAGDMAEKGDLRLALRALYLALLAHLGDKHLILIAKFKSNYDYVTELNRRAHELPELERSFRDNVRIFEFAWYGMHEVEPATLQKFKSNIQRIKEDAGN